MFYGNGFPDDASIQAGVYVAADCLPLPGNTIQDNLIIGNSDFGIRYFPAGNPNFQLNGYLSNGDGPQDDVEGCMSNPGEDIINVGDPVFVNAAQADFHLLWNTPAINAGSALNDQDPLGNPCNDALRSYQFSVGLQVNYENSRNDLGAYGGDGGGLYGYDPYVAITTANPPAQITANLPENEYYFANCYYIIPQGSNVTINPGVFIKHDEAGEFRVYGEAHLQGQENSRICLVANEDGIGTDIWNQLQFKDTASPNSELHYVCISGAYTGLRFTAVPDGANRIPVENCFIRRCQQLGMEIYDTRVDVTGLADDDPDKTENRISDVIETGQDLSDERGVKISFSLLDDVRLTGLTVDHCGTASNDEYLNCGIFLFGADPSFLRDARLEENAVVGLTTIWSSPNLTPNPMVDANANDIRNNGPSFNPQAGVNGAEVYIGSQSALQFERNDIFQTNPAQNSKLIYAHSVTGNFTITGNSWGVADPSQYFFTDNGNQFNWNPPHQNNPNQIDDIRDLRRGIMLVQEGQFREAIRLFRQVIADDPQSMDAIAATRYILACYSRIDDGLNDVRGIFSQLIDDYEDTPLGRIVRMQLPMVLVQERRYEEARDEFADLRERAPRAADRVFADICAREIEYQVFDGDRVNSVRDLSIQRAEIDSLTYLLGSIEDESQKTTPTRFELTSVYPNPFNSTAVVRFNIDRESKVEIGLYDIAGREALRVQVGQLRSGSHEIILEGDNLSAGVYLLQLKADERTTSQKIVLVK